MTSRSDGRKLLRLEVRNASTPMESKPEWIKTRIRTGPHYQQLAALVSDQDLHTVCQEAACPNIFECWEDREATFLIGGDQCTRRCDFCMIDTGKPAVPGKVPTQQGLRRLSIREDLTDSDR
jgi:lipoic acid synthetase